MSIHDNNSPNRPQPSQYGRVNPLAALLNKGLSPHHLGNRGQSAGGFKDYSYSRSGGSSGLESMFNDAVVVSDEQLKAQITELCVEKGNQLCGFLQRKVGRYWELAKKAINIFPMVDQTGLKDPVLVTFSDELLKNVKLYNYCCTYACLIVSAKFVEIELSGSGDRFRSNPANVDSCIVDSLLDAFAMEFLQWLEHHPEVVNLQRQLHPVTLGRIDKIESAIDRLQFMVSSLDVTGKMPIPFPYRAGALKRVAQTSYPDTPVYTAEGLYGEGIELTDSWGLYSAPQSTAPRQSGDWLDAYLSRVDDFPRHHHQVREESVGPYEDYQTTVGSAWEDEIAPVKPSSYLLDEAKKVTRRNRMGYDYKQWFRRIPGDRRYVVHPDHFKYLSQRLEYDGPDAPYARSGWQEYGCIPVVQLDWERGLYKYQNVYVGEDKVDFILTNPERVLPKLTVVNDELQIKGFDESVVEELNQAVEESIKRKSGKECRVLEKPPKAIYGNAPMLIKNGDDVIRSVREVNRLVKAKVDYAPDVLVLPLTARRLLSVDDAKFDYRKIEEHLPFLVNGTTKEYDVETFIKQTKSGVVSTGSRRLAGLILDHVTGVINRWFIERRFYNDVAGEPGDLRITNAFEDIPELLEKMKRYDPASAREFIRFLAEPFFAENIPLFGNTVSHEKVIDAELKGIEDPLLLEARKEEMQQSVCIEKSFALAKINPMKPLEGGRRVVIQGSTMPEIRWLMDTVPERMHKHFSRDVPLVVCFAKDTDFRAWVVTRSAFCDSKFSLRELNTKNLTRFRIQQ